MPQSSDLISDNQSHINVSCIGCILGDRLWYYRLMTCDFSEMVWAWMLLTKSMKFRRTASNVLMEGF